MNTLLSMATPPWEAETESLLQFVGTRAAPVVPHLVCDGSQFRALAGAAGAVRLSELGDLLASVLGVRSAAPRAAALPVADLLHRPATNLLVTVDGFPSDVDGALARAPRAPSRNA